MGYLIAVLLVPALVALIVEVIRESAKACRKLKLRRVLRKYPGIFDRNYIDTKTLYLGLYNELPCVIFIHGVDTSKVYEYIAHGNAGKVKNWYQQTQYNWQSDRFEFTETIFILENRIVIELGGSYAEILYTNRQYEYASNIAEVLKGFRKTEPERITVIGFQRREELVSN